MNPAAIVSDEPYRRATNAVDVGQCGSVSTRGKTLPNLGDFKLGQFGRSVRRPIGTAILENAIGDVISVGSKEKMRWIAARRVIATMKHSQIWQLDFVRQRKGHSMGALLSS